MTAYTRPLTLVVAISCLLAGCTITPQPISRDQLVSTLEHDRTGYRAEVEPLGDELSLAEAVARALKYNLDYRTTAYQQALASGQLEAGRYDMLPKLLANAGYSWRDRENIRNSEDSVTGAPSLANPSISSAASHTSGGIGFSWSLLDFGASYYAAKQSGDRVLIAAEQRRKSLHNLLQKVRTAYWNALAAQTLQGQVIESIAAAERALSRARELEAANVRDPDDTLRYQKSLLENLRLLEAIQRNLALARIELASLIGLPVGEPYRLSPPGDESAGLLDFELAVEEMESLALANNAELHEAFYKGRIAAHETRRAMLKLFPGISFDYSYKFDNDRFLINDRWAEAGARISFNLLSLPSIPARMRAADHSETLEKSRLLTLQMALLARVHLSRQEYLNARQEYRRAHSIWEIEQKLSQRGALKAMTELGSELEGISAEVSAIVSLLRRFQALARVNEALGKVQSTLGMEPRIGPLEGLGLSELTGLIAQSLNESQEETRRREGEPRPPSIAATPSPGESDGATLNENRGTDGGQADTDGGADQAAELPLRVLPIGNSVHYRLPQPDEGPITLTEHPDWLHYDPEQRLLAGRPVDRDLGRHALSWRQGGRLHHQPLLVVWAEGVTVGDEGVRLPRQLPSATHTLAVGEVIGSVAQHYYGLAGVWPAILAANGVTLDPQQLRAGTTLNLPESFGLEEVRRAILIARYPEQ